MIKNFEDLWQAHTELLQEVLIKKIKSLKTADLYIGNTPDAWYNFALPKVKKPTDLDLGEIKKVLSLVNPLTSIYLWEDQIEAGFPEFLKQKGYQFFGTDIWTVFDLKKGKSLKTEIPIKHIGLSEFPDYDRVTVEVFKEEGYDDRPYNEICREILTGKRKSQAPNFASEFFMVYKNSQPAAGAGLFLTNKLGYFHNDATFRQFRRKGYHTNLIKERIKFCLDRKIKTIYSIVEHEKQSFRNYSRCGFEPWQVAKIFVLKTK